MEEHLIALEDKVAKVSALCAGLRAENVALQARLSAVTIERAELSQRLEAARQRLEALLAKLPEA